MSRKNNKFLFAVAFYIVISINGINTQSEPSIPVTQIVEATTVSSGEHQHSHHNGSTESIESEEAHIFNQLRPNGAIESASRVVVASEPNSTVNELKFPPAKHPVEELRLDEARKVISYKNANDAKIRAHVRYDEVTGELIDGDHPCHRECREGEEPMICYYHFVLEWYQTMSKACYNCPYNETDCARPDCIPADGMNRPLNVVNRKMPGPSIEVCQHDRVIVDVENDLMTEGTTVHWHGQHQRGTPYMDGTPYVTQCPIVPETTFRYQFNASHAGTHFWHSHSGMQRADGAAGPFIIRKPKSQDYHGNMYDYDISEHVMLVTDWIHDLSIGVFTDHHHSSGDNKPPTLLVNGVGRFKVFNNDTEKPMYMKTARFNVEQGYKYRFRVINAEFLNCPIELSVDGHNITVIASDGYDLQPITTTSLVTYAGERFDFILDANNEIDNYWIRFRGLMDCDEVFTQAKQVAVLHYDGAMDLEPPGDPNWFEAHNEGLQLNALNKGEEEDETICMAEMRSIEGYDDSLKEVADYQFYVAYDFYAKNNSHFHRSPYYGYYQGINGINSQSEPSIPVTQIVEATTVSSGEHQHSHHNGSTESIESEEAHIFNQLRPNGAIESASRVVVASEPNSTVNELKFPPAKHPVKELSLDEARKVISYKNANDAKIRAHVRYDEVTGELIDGDHPCHRECREGEEPMICYYHFVLEWYQTMSKACYNCPYNETDCARPDCIPADGMNRPLNVVNRKMPGPSIEVCQHDRVIVDVENDLMTEGTTVHWHGQHQRGTPYMDGTPYVTQCPIVPETTFRYQFNASHAGTHFWHSHSGMQRADGAAGPFIIRKPKSQDYHGNMYDYDISEHVMLVTDWIHDLSIGVFTDHHHSSGDNKPPTLLVNGVGRFKVFNNDTEKPMYMKTARFNVEQGYKYRFRVINAEFLNCPIELSVDGHNITVIASDGYDLQPITTTSLVTYAGERFDFILDANNEIDNYWIRFRGLMDCDEVFTQAKQVAVLHYDGAMDLEPPGDPNWFEAHNEGLQLNALNKGEEEDETICMAEMRSIEGYDDSLKEVADYQFYVAYDFYAKNNSHFHRSPYYGYYQVPTKPNRLYTPQLNHISMKLPSSPLLTARPSLDNFCNSSSIDESCEEGYCECSHVLAVKLNSVVELIIVDEGVTFDANHPFHLHGHSFRVVGLRRLGKEITVDEIKAYDKAGLLKRNLKNAPIKDTVTVPDGGYTVIRFKADNPGYWLFHCHIEFHVEIGMALVFKVGEHKDMAPIPRDFPTCGSYLPDNMLEHATTEVPKSDNDIISISHWWPVVVINNNSTSSSTAIVSSSATLLFSIWLLMLNLLS